MNPLIVESLNRTLLLMRDDLCDEVSDSALVNALTQTEVVLLGDAENLASHAAQCAFVTAAVLMARSGHRVYLAATDVPLIGHQTPLHRGTLVASLMEIGADLLPDIEFSVGAPRHAVDLCVRFGDSRPSVAARRVIGVNASAWSAFVGSTATSMRWLEPAWPMGSLAVAALAAGEAFKACMHKLRRFARVPVFFDLLFAFVESMRFDLAAPSTRQSVALGSFDFVSGGAIANAALYCLARAPLVSGDVRIIEAEASDLTNLNRYMLLRRSRVAFGKGDTLQSLDLGDLGVHVTPIRYEEGTIAAIGELAPRVLVGVDHIPTRWAVQRANPRWLGIGATTHWCAMSSFHKAELACAWCMHPRDDATNAPIPTVAFVSFWSGLLLAAHFVRSVAGDAIALREQHVFLTPLRPESAWWSPVAVRRDCPICGHDVMTRAA
jgi:hypothetical protein